MSLKASLMRSRSARGTSRRWRAAGLVITKPHVMSPFVERNEFATLVGKLSFSYCDKVASLRLFFKLRYHGSRGAILQGSG
jgi:hypothetical protein